MAITASGYFGLTFEKQLKNADPGDIESTSVSVMLVQDAFTPN